MFILIIFAYLIRKINVDDTIEMGLFAANPT